MLGGGHLLKLYQTVEGTGGDSEGAKFAERMRLLRSV